MWEIGVSLYNMATAAARAALPIPTSDSVCSILTWYGCECLGFLKYTLMVMHAIAHRDCRKTYMGLHLKLIWGEKSLSYHGFRFTSVVSLAFWSNASNPTLSNTRSQWSLNLENMIVQQTGMWPYWLPLFCTSYELCLCNRRVTYMCLDRVFFQPHFVWCWLMPRLFWHVPPVPWRLPAESGREGEGIVGRLRRGLHPKEAWSQEESKM